MSNNSRILLLVVVAVSLVSISSALLDKVEILSKAKEAALQIDGAQKYLSKVQQASIKHGVTLGDGARCMLCIRISIVIYRTI